MGFVPLPKEPKKQKPVPGIRRRFGDGTVEYVHKNGAIGRIPIFNCTTCGQGQLVSPLAPATEILGYRKICWQCFEDERIAREAALKEERETRLAARAELMQDYTETYIAGGVVPCAIKRREVAFTLACVDWRDRQKIAEIYKEAKRISEKTGIPQDVDHIYPIQSVYGCGLHVHHNLRIIPASENRSKSNKFPTHDSPALN